MIFKCPVCGERHIVPDRYDNKDYVCANSANRLSPKTFQDMVPTDLLTRSGYNMNTASTRVDEKRAVTILIDGPSFRRTGDKIGTRKKNF